MKVYSDCAIYRKGDVIYNQFRDMGASVDWDRAVFMMDPVCCDLKYRNKVFSNFRR